METQTYKTVNRWHSVFLKIQEDFKITKYVFQENFERFNQIKVFAL